MWLLYSMLGKAADEPNALFLGDLPVPYTWGDVRKRAGGLIGRNESCFAWNGADWGHLSADGTILDFIDGNELHVKLVPTSGARLKPECPATPSSKVSAPEDSVRSTVSSVRQTKSSLVDSTEKVLSDTAKKMTSMMGATLSSLAKTATETVKSVNETALPDLKATEQIGNMKVKVGKKIAEGGFSEIFILKPVGKDHHEDGSDGLLALKKCRAQTPEQLKQLQQEIESHEKVRDVKHILQLLDSDIKKSSHSNCVVQFVFPLCSGGGWHEVFPSLSEEENLRIFLGAAKGLRSLHERGLLHRDVKPHNVLLKKNKFPVLMDLGSTCALPIHVGNRTAASLLAEEAGENCSAPYRAPELWNPEPNSSIGGECDVWSLGCSLFAVTHGDGYSPYEDPYQGVLKLAILNGSPPRFTPKGSELVRSLIQSMVCLYSRSSLAEVIHKVENHLGKCE